MVQRDRTALLGLLDENVSFLRVSAQSFDAGFEAEAKRLAVTLRVLLHDTQTSHSLLTQLGVKSQLRFVDTADHIDPHNLIVSAPGLVIMRMTSEGGSYVAPLDKIQLPPNRIHPPAPFDPWWTGTVARDSSGTTWHRRRFVTTMANKEGGAHVDPNLNAAYESLAKHNGLGFISKNDAGELPFSGDVVAMSVRQITHEILQTLEGATIS